MCIHNNAVPLSMDVVFCKRRQKTKKQKRYPLQGLYGAVLLMVFLMAADGCREPLALGLGVQRSFNKSQSVLCHYINIFGQLLWRSGGAPELVVCRRRRNIWCCKSNKHRDKVDSQIHTQIILQYLQAEIFTVLCFIFFFYLLNLVQQHLHNKHEVFPSFGINKIHYRDNMMLSVAEL